MKKIGGLIYLMLIITSCGTSKHAGGGSYGNPQVKQTLLVDNTFLIKVYSYDKTYGYTEKNPVMVGGTSDGPKNERRFLNALAGPKGETIEYYRIGSCCPFNTKNSSFGGMLDMYNISYGGLEEDIVLYINMYDSDTLKVPVGLELKY